MCVQAVGCAGVTSLAFAAREWNPDLEGDRIHSGFLLCLTFTSLI